MSRVSSEVLCLQTWSGANLRGVLPLVPNSGYSSCDVHGNHHQLHSRSVSRSIVDVDSFLGQTSSNSRRVPVFWQSEWWRPEQNQTWNLSEQFALHDCLAMGHSLPHLNQGPKFNLSYKGHSEETGVHCLTMAMTHFRFRCRVATAEPHTQGVSVPGVASSRTLLSAVRVHWRLRRRREGTQTPQREAKPGQRHLLSEVVFTTEFWIGIRICDVCLFNFCTFSKEKCREKVFLW